MRIDANLNQASGTSPRAYEEVARLPRSQQEKIVEIVDALVDQFKRKAS